MKRIHQLTVLLLLWILAGCTKDDLNQPVANTDMANLQVPQGFRFEMTKEFQLNLKFHSPDNSPYANIRFALLDKPVELGGEVLWEGASDANGVFDAPVVLPSRITEAVLWIQAPSFIPNLVLPLSGNALNFTVGGNQPSTLQTFEEKYPNQFPRMTAQMRTGNMTSKYSFRLGTFNTTTGRPNYLEQPSDVITQSLLNMVNVSLPERRPVPSFNPQYLNDAFQRNIVVRELSDVFVTFVSQVTSNSNSLFYYVFDSNNPPTSANGIDSLIAVFPNVKTSNSSGFIAPGDKVRLGRFPAGKTIGFAMVVNGWRGGPSVTAGNMIVYTQKEFNPETNPALRQHTVLLHDAVSNRFIYGFEDTRRDGGADNDFNDCVFYSTCNPVTGIDTTNCLPAKRAIDTDLDGVFDEFDEYPTDAQRAYNNWGVVSTLAFEDLWPSLGDYDFNDMVVGYQINRVTNAANQVKDIRGKFWVNATGAGFSNGFGIELPVAPNTIRSVTGTRISSNYIRNAANGTEQGQSRATVIIFDDANSVLPRNGSAFVNTERGRARVNTDTLNVVIEFTNTVSNTTLGNAPYNPFLIQNKNRAVEIHLPDMRPTSLANQALLGSGADKSDASRGIYYKTSRLLPWAIHIPAAFNHPIEKTQISAAHLRFVSWASSGGTQFTDWYLPRSGYRNSSFIY